MNASLTGGPQIQDIHAFDNYKKKENYLQYVQYTEHAASGLPNPTHLEGEVRFIQAQNQLVTTQFEKM